MRDKIKEFIKEKPLGYEVELEAVVDVVQEYCKQENKELKNEIERLRTAIDYILWLSNKKNPHLGHPRLSDRECVFCMGYFAINNGSFGYSLTTEDYKKLIEDFKKSNSPDKKG